MGGTKFTKLPVKKSANASSLQLIGVCLERGRKKAGARESGLAVHVHPMSGESFFPYTFPKIQP